MGGTGGLVKFDFLGLKTLTVIQNAVEQILGSGRKLHAHRRRRHRALYACGRDGE